VSVFCSATKGLRRANVNASTLAVFRSNVQDITYTAAAEITSSSIIGRDCEALRVWRDTVHARITAFIHGVNSRRDVARECRAGFMCRTARDFWQAKGPSEVLDRLQRGDISVEAASLALGVGVANLAAYMAADFSVDKGQLHHFRSSPSSLFANYVI
jgi:hypothetical protein